MKRYVLPFILIFLTLFLVLQYERMSSGVFLIYGNMTGDPKWYTWVTEKHLSRAAAYNRIMMGSGEKVPALIALSQSGGDAIDARISESLGDLIALPILSTGTASLSEGEIESLKEAAAYYRSSLEREGDVRVGEKYRIVRARIDAYEPSSDNLLSSTQSGMSYTTGDSSQFPLTVSPTLTDGERAEISYTLEDLKRIEANRSDVTDFFGNHSPGALQENIHSLYNSLTENTGGEKRDW